MTQAERTELAFEMERSVNNLEIQEAVDLVNIIRAWNKLNRLRKTAKRGGVYVSGHAASLTDRLFAVGRRSHPKVFAFTEVAPPISAEFLFYLVLPRQNADAIVGDLEEGYKALRQKFGHRRANFWYWTQTVMSLGPIVWVWVKRIVMKPVLALFGWAVGKGLIGHDGWLAAVVELWKRVRS